MALSKEVLEVKARRLLWQRERASPKRPPAPAMEFVAKPVTFRLGAGHPKVRYIQLALRRHGEPIRILIDQASYAGRPLLRLRKPELDALYAAVTRMANYLSRDDEKAA